MRRRTTASALAAVGFLAALAAGQPPGFDPADPVKQPPGAKTSPPADPTDALIQKALANDPDVQVARAKLALAEAEVAKARQASVARVLGLRAQIEQQQAEVKVLTEVADLQNARRKAGAGSYEELLAAQVKLATAKAALARSETELRLLTGDGPKAAVAPRADTGSIAEEIASLLASTDPDAVARALRQSLRGNDVKSLAGPIPARLGAALEKRVSLGTKGQKVTFTEALDVFKAKAGFDIPVRSVPQPPPEVVSDGVELPVIAWLQMFQDVGGYGEEFTLYVREYGLLVADRKHAPPDAVTLTAFWRAHSAAEAAPVARQPEPKQPPAKQHAFAHDKLPATIKVKAGEAIFVTFPVKTADVEEAKAGADNPGVVVQVASRDRMLLVSIRSERAGKARVTWDITDAAGRRFSERGREVEFE